jgi:(1->4)-alpha-D-glucan 1-alpha-D-glucosylmutase
MTAPGVPDFYQGCELWDLNLVDPDNRRPVDYTVRQKLLSDLKKKFEAPPADSTEFISGLLRDEKSGMMKLFLIWRALNFRKAQRELFDGGDYAPLSSLGEKREHVCAFTRTWKEQEAIIVVPRLVFGLAQKTEAPPTGDELWRYTVLTLPRARVGDSFRNVLTRETVTVVERGGKAALELGQILKSFPVALLERVREKSASL